MLLSYSSHSINPSAHFVFPSIHPSLSHHKFQVALINFLLLWLTITSFQFYRIYRNFLYSFPLGFLFFSLRRNKMWQITDWQIPHENKK